MNLKSQILRLHFIIGVGCLFLVTACRQEQELNQASTSTTASPTSQVAVSPSLPSIPVQEWSTVQPGVEWQTRQFGTDSIALVRIDPAQVRIRVAYDPQAPKKLSEWINAIHPLVAINGGYFEEDYKATALTISDGVVSGTSYQGFGGMLTVKSDGSVELTSLLKYSSLPGKDVVQAIQSFPRLVWDGQVIPKLDNEQQARRTAVAIDYTGHLLLIVSDTPLWTLAELGQWLKASDLGIGRCIVKNDLSKYWNLSMLEIVDE